MCKTRFYVRDGALIGDFRDSIRPLVWRMELARVYAAAFTVEQKGSLWELGVEGSQGEFSPIAAFSTKKAAHRALAALASGLRGQSPMIRLKSLIRGVIAILFLGLLYVYVIAPLLSPALPTGQQIPTGQSVPADQALQAPKD